MTGDSAARRRRRRTGVLGQQHRAAGLSRGTGALWDPRSSQDAGTGGRGAGFSEEFWREERPPHW
ncbi:hypothetical protein [uncultured Corynebacterium sp.]|uniref:hypothetical protein n=1 Tax=uncultured Corynebacterium sp. TaxID=159447 RepID=UPI0025DA3ECE|nr:hypothetical protein [uncultured Corynebacterium sp.]